MPYRRSPTHAVVTSPHIRRIELCTSEQCMSLNYICTENRVHIQYRLQHKPNRAQHYRPVLSSSNIHPDVSKISLFQFFNFCFKKSLKLRRVCNSHFPVRALFFLLILFRCPYSEKKSQFCNAN